MAVLDVSFMATTLKRTVPIKVIIPTDKRYFPGMKRREEGKPYKTLYLLHGVLGSAGDWLYGTRIQRWAEERDLVVVMPAGENSFYVDQPWNCSLYSEFIGSELISFTRKTFPLSHKREDTYIAGLSMGGYGALYNGFKFNETFGAIGALSAALVVNEKMVDADPDSPFFASTPAYLKSCFGPDLAKAAQSELNPFVLVDTLLQKGKELPALYMACGDHDSLLADNRAFSEFLTQKGVDHVFEVGPGAHEWDFWDTYVLKFLNWLPLEGKQAGMNSGNVGV